MDTLNVPELPELPDPAPYDEDPVAFADFLLTRLFLSDQALLHAEYSHPEPSITWFIRPCNDDGPQNDFPVAVSPSLGSFRSVLARFGHHYLDGQLYGGFAMKFLKQREAVYRSLIYTSNMGQSGFWIRVYSSDMTDSFPPPPPSE